MTGNGLCVGPEKISAIFILYFLGLQGPSVPVCGDGRLLFNFLCRPKRSKVQDTKRRYDHLSSSASKIVNYRTHHHGTMLISTRLDMLGDLRVKGKVRHYDRIPCFRIPGAHMARRSWSPRTRRVAHGPRQKWMLVRRNQPQLASGRYPVSAR